MSVLQQKQQKRVWEAEEMLQVAPPQGMPEQFESWWRQRYKATLLANAKKLDVRVQRARPFYKHWRQWLGKQRWISFLSADGFRLHGWLVLPKGTIKRGLVIGHGYGGRAAVDLNYSLAGTVYLFPCLRGLGRSKSSLFPERSSLHVTHGLESRDSALLGFCVEDFWSSVSALLSIFPEIEGSIGYQGVSFGGGIGILAGAWDKRISRMAISLPTFGHHPLRLSVPSCGSSQSLARYAKKHPKAMQVLAWYDAAFAAQFVQQPVLVSPALCDPVVPPPGQFAVSNALKGEKKVQILSKGHCPWRENFQEQVQLYHLEKKWFSLLGGGSFM